MKGFPAHQGVSPAKQALKCPNFKNKSNFWPNLGRALGKATDFIGVTDFEDDGTLLSRLYDTIKTNRKRRKRIKEQEIETQNIDTDKNKKKVKTIMSDKVPDQGGKGEEEEYLNYADPLMDDPTTFV